MRSVMELSEHNIFHYSFWDSRILRRSAPTAKVLSFLSGITALRQTFKNFADDNEELAGNLDPRAIVADFERSENSNANLLSGTKWMSLQICQPSIGIYYFPTPHFKNGGGKS